MQLPIRASSCEEENHVTHACGKQIRSNHEKKTHFYLMQITIAVYLMARDNLYGSKVVRGKVLCKFASARRVQKDTACERIMSLNVEMLFSCFEFVAMLRQV
jgi:hypothetical protein